MRGPRTQPIPTMRHVRGKKGPRLHQSIGATMVYLGSAFTMVEQNGTISDTVLAATTNYRNPRTRFKPHVILNISIVILASNVRTHHKSSSSKRWPERRKLHGSREEARLRENSWR